MRQILTAYALHSDTSMTIAQTLKAIKAIDPILTARWISETREYRISIRGLSQTANENIAYYTQDSDDAIATAKAMLQEPHSND